MLKGQALNQFLLKKTCITWDSVPIQDAAIIDLRNDSLNLLDYGMLKRAAVLLFHHNPKKWISRSYITIRYFETDSELRYQDEIHGSLLSQAEKIIDLVFTKYLKAEISYQGVTRIETYPFPKEAIREAVFNIR